MPTSVLIRFPFPALALALLFRVCSQFPTLLFYQAGPLGLWVSEWAGVGSSEWAG